MKRSIVLIALLAPSAAFTTPCDPVSRTLTDVQKTAWSASIARQLGVKPVTVRQAFVFQGWRIVYVETAVTDPAFLFFEGDPVKVKYTTMWSGAAEANEENSILAWTTGHAHGIPSTLAKCFAWHVTQGRGQ
ncbi:hypothetical protein SAMN05216570_3392 [Dyella sp. OK004]|uniref:hypothetical protein n=1 Tax=Dyella sp. OK004 TaxID=1855292 RepID=UPI0008DEDAD8|nr:hypothetical protein [Dyella sp. OK004]SFS16830.1 hypothetical protein SAMN05216570_3392 [Dyella sp. OK004]